jgi:hypothetical protein
MKWAMTVVQGGGKSAQVRWLVLGGGGARHPIGQNRGQESTKPLYKKKKPKDKKTGKKK